MNLRDENERLLAALVRIRDLSYKRDAGSRGLYATCQQIAIDGLRANGKEGGR